MLPIVYLASNYVYWLLGALWFSLRGASFAPWLHLLPLLMAAPLFGCMMLAITPNYPVWFYLFFSEALAVASAWHYQCHRPKVSRWDFFFIFFTAMAQGLFYAGPEFQFSRAEFPIIPAVLQALLMVSIAGFYADRTPGRRVFPIALALLLASANAWLLLQPPQVNFPTEVVLACSSLAQLFAMRILADTT